MEAPASVVQGQALLMCVPFSTFRLNVVVKLSTSSAGGHQPHAEMVGFEKYVSSGVRLAPGQPGRPHNGGSVSLGPCTGPDQLRGASLPRGGLHVQASLMRALWGPGEWGAAGL
ncbi:hypothetical protein H1C71_021122 [Ictidomys tridecemlineatus]|nr:hypothetical protein H1C71_021122 [Ictidomys tridecemlineatus]